MCYSCVGSVLGGGPPVIGGGPSITAGGPPVIVVCYSCVSSIESPHNSYCVVATHTLPRVGNTKPLV